MWVEYKNDLLQIIIPTFWLMSTLALIYDRYFLQEKRFIEHMIDKTKKEGRCVVCGRPMILAPAPQDEKDKE